MKPTEFQLPQAALLMASGTFDSIHDLMRKNPAVMQLVVNTGRKLRHYEVSPDYALLKRLEEVRRKAIERIAEQKN